MLEMIEERAAQSEDHPQGDGVENVCAYHIAHAHRQFNEQERSAQTRQQGQRRMARKETCQQRGQ